MWARMGWFPFMIVSAAVLVGGSPREAFAKKETVSLGHLSQLFSTPEMLKVMTAFRKKFALHSAVNLSTSTPLTFRSTAGDGLAVCNPALNQSSSTPWYLPDFLRPDQPDLEGDGISWEQFERHFLPLIGEGIDRLFREGKINGFTREVLKHKLRNYEEFGWFPVPPIPDPAIIAFPCETKLWNALMKLLKLGRNILHSLDMDGDGDVDPSDINLILGSFDLNGDGCIDAADLRQMLETFDKSGNGRIDPEEGWDMLRSIFPGLGRILDELKRVNDALEELRRECGIVLAPDEENNEASPQLANPNTS